MITPFRAATASLAGLALFALSGPLLAGPFGGGRGYSTGGSYGYSGEGYSTEGAPATGGGCSTCATPTSTGNCGGPKVDCPPPYCHVYEGPPCLKWKRGCPRPVCDPCELPHFGYFQTCWSPWPYPPDW